MGKTFNDAVRKQFASRMAAEAPQFVPTKVPSAHAWPGERAFAWQARPGIKCWISLVTSHKGYNEFFVEVGWSVLDRYPELSFRPSLAGMEAAENALRHPEFMCRVSSLGETPGTWSYRPHDLDAVPKTERLMLEVQAALAPLDSSQAENAAIPLVEDSMRALVRIGIPFLERSSTQLSAVLPEGSKGNAV